MVKLGKIAKTFGKNLASIVVGAGALIGASKVGAEALIPTSVTNKAPLNPLVSAHYVCNNVKFNGRISPGEITLFYKLHKASDGKDYILGGLTIPANSTNTFFDASYLYCKDTPSPGVATGQVATNMVNSVGTWEWFGAIDHSQNGASVYQGVVTGDLYFEEREYLAPNQISFTGMQGFPSDKVSTVSIAEVNIKGYEDDSPANGIPDYFEEKYNLPMNTTTNTDSDNDGQSNYQEWVAGTNPTNATSYFGVKSFENGTNTFALNIGNTLEGRVYGVKATPDLANPNSWTNAIPEVAGNETNTLYITKDPMKQQEFYKPSVKLSPEEYVNF